MTRYRNNQGIMQALAAVVLAAYGIAIFAGLVHIAGMQHAEMAMADCPYAIISAAPCADIAAHVQMWQTFSMGIFAVVAVAAFVAAVWSRVNAAIVVQLHVAHPIHTDYYGPPNPLRELFASGILSPQAP